VINAFPGGTTKSTTRVAGRERHPLRGYPEGIHLKANWHLLFKRRSLIYEHDRNIILYPVKKLALVADKTIPGVVEPYVTLALRTA
jgi:hypothetical protein